MSDSKLEALKEQYEKLGEEIKRLENASISICGVVFSKSGCEYTPLQVGKERDVVRTLKIVDDKWDFTAPSIKELYEFLGENFYVR